MSLAVPVRFYVRLLVSWLDGCAESREPSFSLCDVVCQARNSFYTTSVSTILQFQVQELVPRLPVSTLRHLTTTKWNSPPTEKGHSFSEKRFCFSRKLCCNVVKIDILIIIVSPEKSNREQIQVCTVVKWNTRQIVNMFLITKWWLSFSNVI